MIILDENIDLIRRRQLISRRVHVRQIGLEIGRSGMTDFDEIIPLLHSLRNPTFLTRDRDFYAAQLCHSGYCLAYFDASLAQTTELMCRFLRHRLFRTQAQRMGKVVCAHDRELTYWQVGVKMSQKVAW